MVLIIVSRNIDLSVGSIVGVVSMTYALLMTDILPKVLGFDNPIMARFEYFHCDSDASAVD